MNIIILYNSSIVPVKKKQLLFMYDSALILKMKVSVLFCLDQCSVCSLPNLVFTS